MDPPHLPAPLADAVASPRSSPRPRVVAPPLRPSRVRRSPSPASRHTIRRPSEGVCSLFATGGGRDGEGDSDRHRDGEGTRIRVCVGDGEGSRAGRDGNRGGDRGGDRCGSTIGPAARGA